MGFLSNKSDSVITEDRAISFLLVLAQTLLQKNNLTLSDVIQKTSQVINIIPMHIRLL